MKWDFDIGFAVTTFTALLFYFRIAMLRGKKRREARQTALETMRKTQGKKKRQKINEPQISKPSIEVSSWALIVSAIVLMLVGLLAKNSPNLAIPGSLAGIWKVMQDFWWVGTSMGFILFIFGFK